MLFVILLVYVYSVSFYFDTTQFGVYAGASVWNLIFYNLIHTNILHLIINSSLFLLYWGRLKHCNLRIVIPILVVSPIIAGVFASYAQPTIGASAIIMSMTGILLAGMTRWQTLKLLGLLTFSFITTGLFAPHINTLIHVYSFVFSSAVSILLRRFIYDR